MPNPKNAALPHPQSFTPSSVSGGDIVTDNVTGLVWERNTPNDAVMNWQSAKDRCTSATLGGYCDWRLPSRIELVSLLDATRFEPALDSTAFTNIYPGHYWSASTSGSQDDWAVNFYLGFTFHEGGVGAALAVRCVRGGTANVEHGSSAASRYRDAGNGALLDPATKLVWQASQSASKLSFADAALYCASASPNGWRAPSVTELQTLVDEHRTLPAIDLTSFPGTASEFFWTSSLYAPITGTSWYVNFSDGSTGSGDAAVKNWVRCVR